MFLQKMEMFHPLYHIRRIQHYWKYAIEPLLKPTFKNKTLALTQRIDGGNRLLLIRLLCHARPQNAGQAVFRLLVM